MKTWQAAVGSAVLAFWLAGPARAQDPVGAALANFERLRPLIGQKAWQADMEFSLSGGPITQSIPFFMAMRDGNSRLEFDLSALFAAQGAPTGVMPAGLGKLVAIVRPDRNKLTIAVPGLKAFCEQDMRAASSNTEAGAAKVERHVEGREAVGSLDCQKVRTVVTPAAGAPMEILIWEAEALQGLPVKMETRLPEGTATVRFRNVKTEPLDEAQFEPPRDGQRYPSVQALLMTGMMKLMQSP